MTPTDYYYRDGQGQPVHRTNVPGVHMDAPPVVGGPADPDELADLGWWRQWEDKPVQPGDYYDLVRDPQIADEANKRVIIPYRWVEWDADAKRQYIDQQIEDQIPTVTVTDEVADPTARAKAEQVALRAKTARVELYDPAIDLDTFNPDLSTWVIQDTDYADNLVTQEVRNLIYDETLKNAGAAGIYTQAEVDSIRSRIQWNKGVAEGTQTGAKTPDDAARSDVALDDEDAKRATIKEITFEHASVTYYLPQVTLRDVPASVDMAQTYAMIYDENNVYRTWLPFNQQADGSWVSDESNQFSAAHLTSSRWRVAVTYGGTTSEYEVTRRRYVVPPDVTDAAVRWGGRINGAQVRARRRR